MLVADDRGASARVDASCRFHIVVGKRASEQGAVAIGTETFKY